MRLLKHSVLRSLAVAVLLATFYTALLTSLREKAPTVDEPGHATAGYTFWKFNDYRFDPENGNLPKRWVALPLLAAEMSFAPFGSAHWEGMNLWLLADDWFYRRGNDASVILTRGRAFAGLFAVALGALVWVWARQLFGTGGAAISLLLYVTSPTVLANGALMTSDMCVALFFLASLWCVNAALERISIARVLISAICMGLLFVSKMSAILIAPVAFALVLLRLARGGPLPCSFGLQLKARTAMATTFAAAVLVHIAAITLVIWAFHGFRYSAAAGATSASSPLLWEAVLRKPTHLELVAKLDLSPEQKAAAHSIFAEHDALQNKWTHQARQALNGVSQAVLTAEQRAHLEEVSRRKSPDGIPRLLELIRDAKLFPEAYIYGCAHVLNLTHKRAQFFRGEVTTTGWFSFFPWSFLLKTPLTSIALMLLSVVLITRSGSLGGLRAEERQGGPSVANGILPLTLFAITYAAVAVLSRINIGHRHLLPIYPALFILAGATIHLLRGHHSGRWRAVLIVLCGLQFTEAAARYPHYLSYFNVLVPPNTAHHHFIDSSLDWGQDLPSIPNYISTHSISGPIFLAYFGTGSPSYYGISATQTHSQPGLETLVESPPLKILFRKSAADLDPVGTFLNNHPEYDPELSLKVRFGEATGALVVKRPDALRLRAGTYFVSASLTAPVAYNSAFGPWSDQHETRYRELEHQVQPLLETNSQIRAQNLQQLSWANWINLFRQYDEFRFARLMHSLRDRNPNGFVHSTILVFNLTDEEITRGVSGPVPPR